MAWVRVPRVIILCGIPQVCNVEYGAHTANETKSGSDFYICISFFKHYSIRRAHIMQVQYVIFFTLSLCRSVIQEAAYKQNWEKFKWQEQQNPSGSASHLLCSVPDQIICDNLLLYTAYQWSVSIQSDLFTILLKDALIPQCVRT